MNLRQDCEDQYCHQNQAQHNQVLQIECQGKTHKQNHLSWGGTIDIQVIHFYGKSKDTIHSNMELFFNAPKKPIIDLKFTKTGHFCRIETSVGSKEKNKDEQSEIYLTLQKLQHQGL